MKYHILKMYTILGIKIVNKIIYFIITINKLLILPFRILKKVVLNQ